MAANAGLSKFPPINWFRSVRRFFKEALHELREVVWPTPQDLKQYTLLVVTVLVGVSLFIAGCQFVLQLVLDKGIDLYGVHGR